jgi:hypothetical protein
MDSVSACARRWKINRPKISKHAYLIEHLCRRHNVRFYYTVSCVAPCSCARRSHQSSNVHTNFTVVLVHTRLDIACVLTEQVITREVATVTVGVYPVAVGHDAYIDDAHTSIRYTHWSLAQCGARDFCSADSETGATKR